MQRRAMLVLLALVPAIALASGCARPGPGARDGYDPVTTDPVARDAAHPATLIEVSVPSADALLNGVVYVPEGAGPHPVVILLHGFPGSERSGDLAHALVRAGWTVLFFHYRGAWGSPGAFSFGNAIDDVDAAVDLVRSAAFATAYRADPTRIVLVGHSMGGFLALTVASERSDVRCVASLAGANLGLFGASAHDPKGRAQLEQGFGGSMGPIAGVKLSTLIDELAINADAFDLPRSVAPTLVNRPVLLVAGARDDVTPPAVHHEPLLAALPGATGVVLDADHAFSSQRIALARTVVDFLAARCL
jgi:pimeloyl-ACP methyl ester carboxylesterase